MDKRVALAWVCDNGHQTMTANLLGGRAGYHDEYRTLVADMACLRHVCACGLTEPPNANSPDRCRSVPCGASAHLTLVPVLCSHPYRINEHLPDGGQCGVCGGEREQPPTSEQENHV